MAARGELEGCVGALVKVRSPRGTLDYMVRLLDYMITWLHDYLVT